MRAESVTSTYRRWAPVYDFVFGRIFSPGRKLAADFANARGRRVLEVGVGTGIGLPLYHADLSVTGIDYSEEMLAKAKARVAELGLKNVTLVQMDAQDLAFEAESFDIVTAAHVLSVVPDPEQALSEMVRVCAKGGYIVISNHFAAEGGVMRKLERGLQPLQNQLGWQADFPIETVLRHEALELCERKSLPPLGAVTWLALKKI